MPYHILSVHVKDAQAYEQVWSWHMWSCTLQNILAFHTKKKSRRISTEFRPAQSQVNRFRYNSVDFGRSANNFVRSLPGIWQDVGEGRHFYEPNWFVCWLLELRTVKLLWKKKTINLILHCLIHYRDIYLDDCSLALVRKRGLGFDFLLKTPLVRANIPLINF